LSSTNTNASELIQDRITQAIQKKESLRIAGGNSKSFYGERVTESTVSTAEHSGIINYEPTELVITVKSGTTLNNIEALLNQNQQMLGFEPPHFSDSATIGGTIACNFSGPRRAAAGSARDFVLGIKMINGNAEQLSFGGEVMKNVAGYDSSRLLCGSMGSLGVLLECSLKTLPKPEAELSLTFDTDEPSAIQRMRDWARKPIPITASCYHNGQLSIRLSSTEQALKKIRTTLGGDMLENDEQYWKSVREQTISFFDTEFPLWRLSLSPNAAPYSSESLIEWNGAQRWITGNLSSSDIQKYAKANGGHATLFKQGQEKIDFFQTIDPALAKIHENLKQAFDPHNIFISPLIQP